MHTVHQFFFLQGRIGIPDEFADHAADANDGGTISSYAIGGTDDPLLEVNSSTGVVSLTANPDYETKNSYSFTATATNAAGTSAATTVTFSITNVIEVPSSTEQEKRLIN